MCCSRGMPGVVAPVHHHAPLSSYWRSCADERACQGWRSHHVVTPKAPFTRPIGKSDNCADEEWGRCPPAAGRDSLTRRRLGRGRSVPPRLADQGDSYADPSGLTRTRRSIVNTGSQRRAVAVGQCRSPESQPRDLLRRYPATDCRAARPRARDERQGRTAARRGALARRLDPIERNSASVTARDGDDRRSR